MHSPLISKIRCHNPNRQKSRVCNRNYLVYIATREGVDLTQTSYDRSLQAELMQIEDPQQAAAANDLYLKYIAERPKSSGLFGNLAEDDPTVLGNHLADLTAQGRNIYRGIVSLCEEDAIELGYDRKETWENFMRSVMPDVASQFKIPIDQLQWTAAVHMEKSHPHCHYMFWSKDPKIRSPYIHVSLQNKCRELLSKVMFQAEREREIIAKTAARDLLLERGKSVSDNDFTSLKKNLVPGTGTTRIPGKLKEESMNILQTKLLDLMNALPSSGRINYALCPPEIKTAVDDVSTVLLSHPDIRKEFTSYLQATENIAKTYSSESEKIKYSRQAAERDIYKRMGNIILASAKTLRKDLNQEAYAAKELAYQIRQEAHQKQQEEYEQQREEYLQKRSAYTLFRSVFSLICNQSSKRQATYQFRMQSTSKENRIAQARKHGHKIRKTKQEAQEKE